MGKEKFEKGALATAKGITIISCIFGGVPIIYGVLSLLAGFESIREGLSGPSRNGIGIFGFFLQYSGALYILIGVFIILMGLFNRFVLHGMVIIVRQNSRIVENTDVIETATRRMAGMNMPGTNIQGMNMPGTNMAGTNLSGLNMSGLDSMYGERR